MICQSCRDRHHEGCRGGTWCCCQHKIDSIPEILNAIDQLVNTIITDDDEVLERITHE